jgi:hypothetical protein
MTTDHQPDSPTGVDALTTGDLGRPLAEFLRPRLAPQVAGDLAGHQLEEGLGLAVAAATADTAANTRRGYGFDWPTSRPTAPSTGCRRCRRPRR